MAIAYLRVSTKQQDVENQKDEITRFAQSRGFKIDKWYKEVVSGKSPANTKKVNEIIRKMKNDDVLIVSELSRLSRTAFESIGILNRCIKKNINLHSVKENYSCTDDLSSIILGVISSIFSELERVRISQRTKEALAKRRQGGAQLGRPKGSSKLWKKLLTQKVTIKKLLDEKVSKSKIARLYGISRVTLYKFIAIL